MTIGALSQSIDNDVYANMCIAYLRKNFENGDIILVRVAVSALRAHSDKAKSLRRDPRC